MQKTNYGKFAGSVPETYDRFMGPLFFEPYASDLVQRVPAREPIKVLELACGTGIVTKALRETLPAGSSITATDLNQAMIDYAKLKLGPRSGVTWRQADATSIPFENDSFEVVVCQFGFMFFPDKETAAREAYRVLTKDGTFIFNVWDSLEENELTFLAAKTIASFFPDNPPDFYALPFGYHDRTEINALLERVGFSRVDGETVRKENVCESARTVATALVKGTPIISQITDREPSSADILVERAADAIRLRCGESPVRSSMQALVWTMRK